MQSHRSVQNLMPSKNTQEVVRSQEQLIRSDNVFSCPNRHGPNRWSRYREIHQTCMMQFKSSKYSHFVDCDSLTFSEDTEKGILLSGEIACLGKILIRAEKSLRTLECLNGDRIVQTVWYAYNASVQDHGNILRYDNQDQDWYRPGHLDEHHKHLFDWQSGHEIDIQWIGKCKWPTLGDLIHEVYVWYLNNQAFLPSPREYATLKCRGR